MTMCSSVIMRSATDCCKLALTCDNDWLLGLFSLLPVRHVVHEFGSNDHYITPFNWVINTGQFPAFFLNLFTEGRYKSISFVS